MQKTMTELINVLSARSHFGKLMDMVEKNESISKPPKKVFRAGRLFGKYCQHIKYKKRIICPDKSDYASLIIGD